MPDPQLKVEGQDEVLRAFNKFSDSADDLKDVNAQVGQALIGDIRSNTRVRSGTLKSSWETTAEPMTAQFANPQKYAVVQEMGGVQVEPTHAVGRAYEANQDAITGAYADGLTKRAKRANIDTA